MWEEIHEFEDFILVYKGQRHDIGGLLHSRTTHQVCCVRDSFEDLLKSMWGNLHMVLEVYLLSIESGKFVVDLKHPGFGYRDGLVTPGWRVAEWKKKQSRQILDV